MSRAPHPPLAAVAALIFVSAAVSVFAGGGETSIDGPLPRTAFGPASAGDPGGFAPLPGAPAPAATPTTPGASPDGPDGAAAAAASGDPASQPAAAAPRSTSSRPGSAPLPSLLGMTLQEAYTAFGAPAEVFSARGAHAWEDDVVFYYPDRSYLFWFKDRVWQVRVDARYQDSFLGLSMGWTRLQVEQTLGTPLATLADSEVFVLPNRGYPVRARLFFTDGKLSDAYIYRGDF